MTLYRDFLFPLFIKRTDPESAHDRAVRALVGAQETALGRALLRTVAGPVPHDAVEVAGLRFPNVLGIAAGLDKNVEIVRALGELGFGHVEVGTLTPRPQPGNPRPRVFRLPTDGAIINRMGFPNCGVEAALPRLAAFAALPHRPVIGVSLGKQKETPLADAAGDYLAVMRAVYPHADYLAVNISSPNTPGLRELQGGAYLEGLCRTLLQERDRLADQHARRAPLFVKIAPDLDDTALESMLQAFTSTGVDGIIATNTTVARPDDLRHPLAEERGGLSGTPLRDRTTDLIAAIHRSTAGKLPIIGVGGIRTAEDAAEKLHAGASLLQVYTGFVYEGPGMASRLLRGLVQVS